MTEKQSTKTKGGIRENSGRPKGVPNKVTTEARELVKNILDANLPKIQEWLESTANGIRDENDKYIVYPNPAKACDIVQNLIEYTVPKLARTEMVGDAKQPMAIAISWKSN